MASAAGRGAAAAVIPAASRFGDEVGHQIFVYQKIDTNQIVYSLTRSLRNRKALQQLTFVGKKSVPARLRKDLWEPLCVLSFQNALQGRSAYRQLLEFKHLHEVAYPLETMQNPNAPNGVRLPKKEQTKRLQDQKANSIADMAHILAMHKRSPSEEELKHARLMVYGEGVKRPRGAPMSKYTPGQKRTAEVLEFRGKLEGVSIWWTNPSDAEYAETWPEEVIHGPLAVNRYTAIWPPPEELLTGRRSSSSLPSATATSGPIDHLEPPPDQRSRWSKWFGNKKTGATSPTEPVAA